MNILVRSSWQTVDIGDTPGALHLIERQLPAAAGSDLAAQLAGTNWMGPLMGSTSNLASPPMTATLVT